ncbi:putative mediator of RNA polymerase II transcription subunit 26 [Drosophila obscura]|uniref:putative mediator of RNA polymerase II transcription subunit 26 n=1 Tax=Drosophila obscura TaxID=7282 RepID=UPI001BB11B16|nr:putative mediator of RNA polymerase II transcription subunit 26 [Drosophila obscura]
MSKKAHNFCSDFNTQFYKSKSGERKPIGSFLQLPAMEKPPSHSNGAPVGEGMTQRDLARGLVLEKMTPTDLENLKWPTKRSEMQKERKTSMQDQIQAQERVCSHKSGVQRSQQQNEQPPQQRHVQQYQKTFNQSPGNQPQQQYLESKYQSPHMVKQQYHQTSYASPPQEQAQRYYTPMKAPPNKASSNGPEPEHSNTSSDESSYEESIQKCLELMPKHRQSNAPLGPKKPELRYPADLDIDEYIRELRNNSPFTAYMENGPKQQNPTQQTHQHEPRHVYHTENGPKQQTYQNPTQQTCPHEPRHVCHTGTGPKQQTYQAPTQQSCQHEARHVCHTENGPKQRTYQAPTQQIYQHEPRQSPPQNMSEQQKQRNQSEMKTDKNVQQSVPLVPDLWDTENGGKLPAEHADRLQDSCEKHGKASIAQPEQSGCQKLKQNKYTKCGLSSGGSSTSAMTVISRKSGEELRFMVRDELRGLVRDEAQLQTVFGQLTESVVCHVKDYLCGVSPTESSPVQSTTSRQYSPKGNTLDIRKQETYQIQNNASPTKGQPTKLEAQKNPQQKQQPNEQKAPRFSCLSHILENDDEDSNFGVDNKTNAPHKCTDYHDKDCPKDKQKNPKHKPFSTASHASCNSYTSISSKSGNELRSMVRDEMELHSGRGDQASRCSQHSRIKPHCKGLKENVSTHSLSHPNTDDTRPGFKNSARVESAPRKGKGATTEPTKEESHQIECSVSVDDLVSCKVITPIIMKMHNKYLASLHEEIQLLEYLEKVPRLVSQIYKDNAQMDQRKA